MDKLIGYREVIETKIIKAIQWLHLLHLRFFKKCVILVLQK